MTKKLKNSGSCTFSCNVGSLHFDRGMCDLWSEISLMFMSLAVTCGIHGDLKPTRISIQLTDKSIVKPNSVIEDVLIRVDKFIIPVDFMVLDMEVDKTIPLIFGRPFIATGIL